MSERDALLQEREKTHGNFKHNAILWGKLCRLVISEATMKDDIQYLAMTMILLKVARVVEHPEIQDHWDDIAGYAKLASEACHAP